MNRIVVKLGVHNAELAVLELFVTQDTLAAYLLEGTGKGVLDIREILDTLGGVANKVGQSQLRSIGSVVPDLGGNVLVPTEVVDEELDVLLGIQG